MAELPTGTVTFLFTDIQGSTALGEQYPEEMHDALIRHDELVEQVVAEHKGHVVRPRGEGDSRFAVFARASDAVAAAAALQQALHAEPWPTPTPLRVRMALHTGEADLRQGDYYGSAVNRCARLRAVAHGGQTLVSLATEQLVRGQLPEGVGLCDLGVHRLRDLQHPERIFGLLVDGGPADWPPLMTLDARPNNLPIQRDPLIGREQEVATIVDLLRRPSVGIVTTTGPGGVGKTRLALQVSAELLDDFADGAWFVDLAPISDPALVISTIAQTLGVRELADQPLAETVEAYLRAKVLLLVLDNFEQILAAAPALTSLLRVAARLKLLVTSREVLRLTGEQEYPVSPLSLPDLQRPEPVDRLTRYAAVALFIQRAVAATPDFQVTTTTAPAVAEICVRLDGLPLAIELAAARIRLLPPEALLQRLSNRLKLLTGGARDQAARQQTLRAAIEWSYKLLEAGEQQLFARLSVFVGGWTLEAAERVCQDEESELEILDGLQSLLDKSLLRKHGLEGEPRFSMLETIREYARDRLDIQRETHLMQQRHAEYYLDLVQTADLTHRRPDTEMWCDRFAADYDNLRAVLAWSQGADGRNELGLRLAGGLRYFWFLRERFGSEGRQWLEAVLSRAGGDGSFRARALCGVGLLAWQQGDNRLAGERLAESIQLWRGLEDTIGLAEALHQLGHVTMETQDNMTARRLFSESLALYKAAGDPHLVLVLRLDLGKIAYCEGDVEAAQAIVDESLAIYRAQDIKDGISDTLLLAGNLAQAAGEYQRAAQFYTEGLAVARSMRMTGDSANMLLRLGQVARHTHDPSRAQALYRESLILYRDAGWKSSIGQVLLSLAGAMLSADHAQVGTQRVVRLLGVGTGILDATGAVLGPAERIDYEHDLVTIHAQLSDAAFAAAWAEGQAMTLEQAIAYALAEGPDG